MQHKTRVLVADPQPIMRAGIRASLEASGFGIAAETCAFGDTVAAVSAVRPDVCLIDGDLPGGCRAAVHAIHRQAPEVAIVVLAERDNSAVLIESLRAGASGFLVKDVDLDQLPRALRAVIAGEAVVPRRFVAGLVEELRKGSPHAAPQSRFAALTKREQEVVDMVRAGWSTSRIANHLFLSPGTVRSHVSAILGKLQVQDRQALIDLTSTGSRQRT